MLFYLFQAFGRENLVFYFPADQEPTHKDRASRPETKLRETNLALVAAAAAAAAAPPRPSVVQRFHGRHDLGAMGMTHPLPLATHPPSMTSISGYTTRQGPERAPRDTHTRILPPGPHSKTHRGTLPEVPDARYA